MTKQMHKLTALHILADGMSALEVQHQKRIDDGDDPATVDLDTARMALTRVVELFLDQGIEAAPLTRLLCDLAALSAGARPSDMLVPAVIHHRRPDAPTIESIKGRLAAIMEFRQQAGLTRKDAARWVVRHLPSKMKTGLGLTSHTTVDSWLLKWGGEHGGDSGSGREGYLHIRAILRDRKPTEPQLKKLIESLNQYLPTRRINLSPPLISAPALR